MDVSGSEPPSWRSFSSRTLLLMPAMARLARRVVGKESVCQVTWGDPEGMRTANTPFLSIHEKRLANMRSTCLE